MEGQQLHPFDWVLFALMLTLSLGIGVYHSLTGGRQRTTKEFLLANRKLRVIPAALSMYVSGISAIFIIGQTAEVYLHGPQTYVGIIGSVIALILCAIIFVPMFYKLKLTSGYQYLHRRYESNKLRLICVLLNMGSSLMHNGLALYAPSTALEAVTGFPWWVSLILTGTVGTVYTTLGGMKAVIWTDVLQGSIMFTGLLAMVILGTIRVGGVGTVFEYAGKGGRLNFFNFNPDPTLRVNFWSLFIGRLSFSMASMAATQANIQRYSALPTLKKAQLSVFTNIPFTLFMSTTITYLGLVMYAYFTDIGCDPLRSGAISNPNQLLPYFVVTVMNYPGVTGLFLSVLFSAALSTCSSNLSSQSALSWKDIIEPRIGKIPEHRKAMITKVLVFVYGIVAICIGLVSRVLPGHLMEVARRAMGAFSGPLVGALVMAVMCPCANAGGAMVGIVASFSLVLWINIGSYITRPHQGTLETTVLNCTMPPNVTALPVPTDPPAWTIFPLYRISFMWITTLATITCISVGLVFSSLLGGRRRWSGDPRLLVPISSYCCFFMPKSVRRFLWCGVDHDATPEGEINLDEEQERKTGGSKVTKAEMNGIPVVSQPGTEMYSSPHFRPRINQQLEYNNIGFEQAFVDSTRV